MEIEDVAFSYVGAGATFGVVLGIRAWIRSALYDTPSTAGTVMLAAFTTAGGLYCLVQAMVYDMLATPRRPLTVPRIGLVPPSEAEGGAGGPPARTNPRAPSQHR